MPKTDRLLPLRLSDCRQPFLSVGTLPEDGDVHLVTGPGNRVGRCFARHP